MNTRCTETKYGCSKATWELHRNCCDSLRQNIKRSKEVNGEDRHVQILRAGVLIDKEIHVKVWLLIKATRAR